MKMAIINSLYAEYLDARASRSTSSFAEAYDELIGEAFGLSNNLCKSLQRIGVDCLHMFGNERKTLQLWSQENGFDPSLPNERMVTNFLKVSAPDLLLLYDPFEYSPEFYADLKASVPSLKKLLIFCCSPVKAQYPFQYCDAVVTCTPGFQKYFEDQGLPSLLLYHCFAPDVASRFVNTVYDSRQFDVVFTGSLVPAQDFHQERIAILEELLRRNLHVVIKGSIPSRQSVLLNSARNGLYHVSSALKAARVDRLFEKIPPFRQALSWDSPRKVLPRKIVKNCQKPVYGQDMLELLDQSKICLNSHIDVAGPYAGNLRLFESTAMGCVLVTDFKTNLQSLFDIEREVVTYKNAEECLEKVQWLLSHPRDAQEIAARGRARCLADHSYDARAKEFSAFASKLL